MVKTDGATARVPELDFEIPAFSQKGGGCQALFWAVLGQGDAGEHLEEEGSARQGTAARGLHCRAIPVSRCFGPPASFLWV